MIISVASGKGGTGKTTVSVALANSLKEDLILLDTDVEEPNASLFIIKKITSSEDVKVLVPKINNNKCTACGKCSDICMFNAIANLKVSAMVFPELCHSCGGCSLICPHKAITETPLKIGQINYYKKNNIDFYEGKIDIGHIMSPALIRTVKKKIESDKLTIIDCPPGTACPMVTSIIDTDYVILVTEPTPFGLNDLIIAVDTVKQMNIPYGVIINKNDDKIKIIDEYCNENNIDILMRIPEMREIAVAYSKGLPLLSAMPSLSDEFNNVIERIKQINGSKS